MHMNNKQVWIPFKDAQKPVKWMRMRSEQLNSEKRDAVLAKNMADLSSNLQLVIEGSAQIYNLGLLLVL